METINIQRWGRYLCCRKEYYSSSMQAVFSHLNETIDNAPLILKNDATSTVVMVTIDGKSIVIKRLNTKGKMHFFRRLFWKSRASVNWDYAQRLQASNILTFEPIALIEERYGCFRGRSYFFCSFLQGIDALHYFAKGAKPQRDWEDVAKGIVLLIHELAKKKIYHRDLNLSNIILVNNKPFLIDLDGMRLCNFRCSTQKLLQKLWRRFMENWDEIPDIAPEIVPLFQTTFEKIQNTRE